MLHHLFPVPYASPHITYSDIRISLVQFSCAITFSVVNSFKFFYLYCSRYDGKIEDSQVCQP